MTTEAQRIAIAEACGFTPFLNCHNQPFDSPRWLNPARDMTFGTLPDYLNSLDAMHEAEKTLTMVQQVTYAGIIADMVKSRHWNHLGFDCLHTTATQRAEAFLRTLNLWV